jgi:hypothetical protein
LLYINTTGLQENCTLELNDELYVTI